LTEHKCQSKKGVSTKRGKSLYYATDKQMIAQVLRWLNSAAAKERPLPSIKDEHDLWKAMNDLAEPDTGMLVEALIVSLNFVDRSASRQGQRRLGQMWLRVVNQGLRECRMFPQIKALGRRKRIVSWSGAPGAYGEDRRAYYAIVPAILSLHERGLLSAVRQCGFVECSVWFHAKHGKSIFHSHRCRNRAHYANLPPKKKGHRKAAARKYMVGYRARERAKALRAKAGILEARGKTQEAADLITKALELEARGEANNGRAQNPSREDRRRLP
jgi:hypothetical protein